MKRDEALNILETFLTDEELSRLKRVSNMTGACISTLIRMAVADYLKNLPRALPSAGLSPTQVTGKEIAAAFEHDHQSDHAK
jgi:hypothetical protein